MILYYKVLNITSFYIISAQNKSWFYSQSLVNIFLEDYE